MVEGDGIHPNRYSLAGRHHRSTSCVRHLRGFRADDLTSGGAALTGRSRALRAFINRTAFDRIDDDRYENIWLCGPAEKVFEGIFEL